MITAGRIARCYDRYVSALRRGDEEAVTAFVEWLAAFWDEGPPEPRTTPAAVSRGPAGGSGVRWYDVGDTVLGYPIRGPVGCYQVPVAETPPPIPAGPPAPRDIPRTVPWRQYGARR